MVKNTSSITEGVFFLYKKSLRKSKNNIFLRESFILNNIIFNFSIVIDDIS